jgi:hypothetical protein
MAGDGRVRPIGEEAGDGQAEKAENNQHGPADQHGPEERRSFMVPSRLDRQLLGRIVGAPQPREKEAGD